MDDAEPPYLHGAVSLLRQCHETVEYLFARFERADDDRTKRKIVETALHELKVHAAIEEFVLHPALAPELVEPEARRRDVRRLIAELESAAGDEGARDRRFSALSEGVRRHIREEEENLFARPALDICHHGSMKRTPLPALLALAILLLAAAGARAQSNQGGGEQLNPVTSPNTIANGGSTGAAMPINKVVVPDTPASDETAPASSEKDAPSKRPLPAAKPPAKKRLSDRALARKIRGEIVHDLTLTRASQNVQVAAAAGKVSLSGTVLSEDDKYKIAAKAAELVGAENVSDSIVVKPAPPSR